MELKRNVRDIVLPEFDKTKHVDGVAAFVFDAPCRYNMILGRDFLMKAGIKLDFQFGIMQWLETTLPMKEMAHWQDPQNFYMALDNDDDELLNEFFDAHTID